MRRHTVTHSGYPKLTFNRDIDQVKADLLSPKHLAQWKDSKAIEDLPGLGQHYCVECAKWFETETSLEEHAKGKPHKRRYAVQLIIPGLLGLTITGRLKQLRDDDAYNQKLAEVAAKQAASKSEDVAMT